MKHKGAHKGTLHVVQRTFAGLWLFIGGKIFTIALERIKYTSEFARRRSGQYLERKRKTFLCRKLETFYFQPVGTECRIVP